MRLLPVSAMYKLPAASAAMPKGPLSEAELAGPPSPPKPADPLPATVVMMPVTASTRLQQAEGRS